MVQTLVERPRVDARERVQAPARRDRSVPTALRQPSPPVAEGSVVRREHLLQRLHAAARVTSVSAPPGSGKTMLLRSWIEEARLHGSAAWVSMQRAERDPQRFWISVIDALRRTAVGAAHVHALTAAPDLDGWEIVEHLLDDLASLDAPVWLLIDDLHELNSDEALAQLELLLLRSPPHMRVLLSSRRDLRVGLHRLRVEGELTELRGADLRFSLDEARELFAAAGVQAPEPALRLLVERTEGWAAGLRLAALSLVGHSDPERFAAEFSGTERTVAGYLLAEVLDRQSEPVKRLLLWTSVLDRVSGPLADYLTGDSGGERILQELEETNAFVVALDARRSWFRYHELFADLLQLELRRTARDEIPRLHGTAADWYAAHGYTREAIRHAQAANNWTLAAHLLSDHWLSFVLNGQAAAAHEMLSGFPPGVVASDPELTLLRAIDELDRGSPEEAERMLALLTPRSNTVPAERREHFGKMLATLRFAIAQVRGNVTAVVEEGRQMLTPPDVAGAVPSVHDGDLRALGLLGLGIAETWALRLGDAELHLQQGVELARRIDRPHLEILGLAYQAQLSRLQSLRLGAERGMQAIELARRHGWSEEPIVAVAYLALGATKVWQGHLDEAERLLQQGERALRNELQRPARMLLHHTRGLLALARQQEDEALTAFRAGAQLADLVVTPHAIADNARSMMVHTLVSRGDLSQAAELLADLEPANRDGAQMRIAEAALHLAGGDAAAACTALEPVLAGSAPVLHAGWLIRAYVLEAIARADVGDAEAGDAALERALDLAEPDGIMLPFLLHPAPRLLERHSRRRTSHACMVAEILSLLTGRARAAAPVSADRLLEPLSESETRILRYLPTNLSTPEIAAELYLSVNTIKTHIGHLYAELGAHRRSDAVERARVLGLLAPSSRRA